MCIFLLQGSKIDACEMDAFGLHSGMNGWDLGGTKPKFFSLSRFMTKLTHPCLLRV